MIVSRLLAALLASVAIVSASAPSIAAQGRYARIMQCAQQLPPAPPHEHDPVAVTISVDGRDVCHARRAGFFSFDRPLYDQTGSEVARYGDHITGTLTDVRLKSDDDATPHPHTFLCMYRDRGLAWKQTAPDTFVATGTLGPTGKRYFTGITASSTCIDYSLKTYPVKP